LIALCIGYHLIAYILLDVIRHPVTGIVGSDVSSSSSYETDYSDIERVVVGKQDFTITTPTLLTNRSSSQSHDGGGMIINDDDDDDDDVIVENNNNEVPVDHAGSRQKVAIRIVNISLFVQVKATWRQNNLPTIIPANDNFNSDADGIGNNDMTTTSKTNNNNNNTRKKKMKKMILSHVSATIDSGRLVALMGGSGSGKTTLLNLLAGRIHPASKDPDKSPGSHLFFRSLLSSQYTGDGQILFNGRVPTGSQRRELVGYGINITH
jgi:ABC-type multidrug transport system fused ATPase/permease subunit